MNGSAEILTEFERCPRAAYWSATWERYKLKPSQMLQRGVHAGLLESERKDFGQAAGEHLFSLAVEPGILSDQHDLHSEVVHLSALADIVTSALRKPTDGSWRVPETLPTWTPSCLMSPDGAFLRRVVFVTSWSIDRQHSICRAWSSLGPVCHYEIPMQILVIVLGSHRDGRYHSFWTRGLRHPVSRQLRFRKKTDLANPFKQSWLAAAREDYDEISTQDWLNAMLSDGVIQDCCFNINLQVPEREARKRITDLAERKLEKIARMKIIPDQSLSICDHPVPCTFRSPCHAMTEPSGKYGFVRIEEILPQT